VPSCTLPVKTFFTMTSRARPTGAPSGQPRQSSDHRLGSPKRSEWNEREAVAGGVERGTRRCGAAAWLAASSAAAHRREPLPSRGRPRTRAGGVPPSRTPGDRACKSQPSGPPAPGTLTPRKDHNQGRTSSLRCGRSTLILIFHGKNRHLSGGQRMVALGLFAEIDGCCTSVQGHPSSGEATPPCPGGTPSVSAGWCQPSVSEASDSSFSRVRAQGLRTHEYAGRMISLVCNECGLWLIQPWGGRTNGRSDRFP
jgi:hypothetical protein